ncbi:acyl-CoA dehydrogenase family protein [Tianweitania sediminis]|uniref:Acyl-CoA dehydrogenase family protein n=1 Tax=Tianweitania sediminis TaxID=1502156 RepID=A0A8J7RH21_9HYPH|nr:acyl-CoA dehydrogenase family protein [Tianweitania sediminis]MBP0438311.1 acyl-CoA dehydrogenase family protein [Tianweitania sediminis]
MDYPLPELSAFRLDVIRFVEANLPADIAEKVRLNIEPEKSDLYRWEQILNGHGWFCGHWPVHAGGAGWSPLKRYVFEQAMAEAGAPPLQPFGQAYVGPVIIEYGTDAQKQRFLPKIIDSTEFWCQGYSEPSAGSDLAGLKLRAERKGDHYVLNGQKLWTSYAHWADMIFLLVRTSQEDRPQKGVSFILADMHTPGITIRPIITLDMKHHVNEVFFDNVEVPVENLVGDEGDGWKIAKFLLATERLIVAETGKARRLLSQVRTVAENTLEAGKPLFEQSAFRRAFTEAEVQLQTLEAFCARQLKGVAQGKVLGFEASLMKIRGSELLQSITELGSRVAARKGLALSPEPLPEGSNGEQAEPTEASALLSEYLFQRAATIYGGSNEIQHNIVSKARFGF